MENKEHNLQDKRCECCGYMTYHREHMGCIRAAEQAQQAEHVPLTAAGSEDQAVYASIASNYHHPPAVAMPDVDWLAQVIRSVDGNHSLGAGALAEKIVDAMLAAAQK